MSTFSTNLGLEQPANGADSGTWDVPLNSDLGLIDQALGTSVSKSFTNVDITLSVAQAAFFQFNCSGTLSGNVNLIFPATIGGRRIVNNQCTGAFTLKVKNGAGDTGIVVGQGYQTPVLLTTGTALYDAYASTPAGAATLASATTTDLGSVPQGEITISGTTTITGFGSSAPVGATRFLTFSGILTLTYNAVSLILPSAANITTAASDTAIATQTSAGNWRISFYQRASGTALVTGTGVTSFNGRQNIVVSVAGDYATAQLTTASAATAPTAGQLGETISSTGTSVALPANVATNVALVTVTAGHWRCFTQACSIVNPGQSVTGYAASISLNSSAFGSGVSQWGGLVIPANNTLAIPPPDLVVRVSGSTIVYLIQQSTTNGSQGTGTLTAVRID